MAGASKCADLSARDHCDNVHLQDEVKAFASDNGMRLGSSALTPLPHDSQNRRPGPRFGFGFYPGTGKSSEGVRLG